MDQFRSPLPEHREPISSSSQSEKTPRSDDPKKERSTSHVDIIALVRSLQRSAGMADCFRIGNVDCDIIDCDWRSYCLGKPAEQKKNTSSPGSK